MIKNTSAFPANEKCNSLAHEKLPSPGPYELRNFARGNNKISSFTTPPNLPFAFWRWS